jgi:RNA polymerase sigma factor for flagellar operon FliA
MPGAREGRGREPEDQDRLADLWRRFKEESAQDARDQLILQYSPLVKYVASRVATSLPASVEQADLVSYGMFGLMDALEKFDRSRAIKFETYAIPRIKGAIIDELRSLDWVPRSVRFKARELDKAYSEVEAKLKRSPTDPEIAEHLGVSVGELHDIVTQISFVSLISVDEPLTSSEGEAVSLLDTLAEPGTDPFMGLESLETRAMLADAINGLTEREKLVITLYYYEGMTLAEIGSVLSVTESRICQIHTKAVGQLRTRLRDDDA